MVEVLKKENRLGVYFGLIFLCAFVMLMVGIKTHVFLGDEIHHYRFAKESYELGHRAVYDTLYGPVIPPGYYYSTEPLWPLGLALFWKATGGASHFIAQLYHLLFFALFVVSIYGLARDLYGAASALHASLLAATIPMVTAFGILLYVDLPGAALSGVLFLLLYRKHYFWAGVMLGLVYLTKRSGAFFIPAIFLLVFFDAELPILKKIKALFFLFGAAFLTVMPDILWRRQHFFGPSSSAVETGSSLVTSPAETILQPENTFSQAVHFAMKQGEALIHEKMRSFTSWKFWEVKEYLNSSLLSPKDALCYFGGPLLILFAVYFLSRRFHKQDRFLWIPIGTYMLIFAFVFHLASDIRYLFPILPLLVILAAKSVELFKKSWQKLTLLGLCLLQFGMVSLAVYQVRQPSPKLQEGFAYIRNYIPEQTVVMYPEGNLLEFANCKVLWGLGGILNLFWIQEEEQMLKLIRDNRLGFIIIKKNRIYNDEKGKVRHHGGYPLSFVERLPQLHFTEQLFENSEMSIWKIDPKILL